MATTSVVSSGLASIAPELKPFYLGTGTKGQADYVPGLLDKGQEVYGQNYQQQIGNQLAASGLGGAGRVAGLSEMEQQLGRDLQNMQTPEQFGTGTGLASQAGQGQLSTTGQAAGYGQMGAGYGQAGVGIGQQAAGLAGMGVNYGMQGAQAGQNYMQMATDPGAQQAFMSPYIQNALNPQLEEIRRQYDISGAQQQGQATRAGAFGGNREALMRSENARNMGTAMNQTIGKGYQDAFTAAQQAQQFGSQLGLQGIQAGIQGLGAANQAYQTGLQGTAQGMQGAQVGLQGVGAQQAGYAGANAAASTLGQLGTQQQAAEMDRLSAKGAYGALERGVEQQGIDAQYSDLMNQLNYPKTQLTGMQGLLTGTPTANMSSTQSTTTPAPSFASQLGGAGLSGLALYQMFNK
jgi:hypothetical protein